MFSHVFAIAFADLSGALAIFDLVRHVNYQPRNVRGLSTGVVQHGDYVSEGFVELFDKIVADDLLILVPGDLACYKKQLAAGLCEHSVSKRFGVDQLPSIVILDKEGNMSGGPIGGLDPNGNLAGQLASRLDKLL